VLDGKSVGPAHFFGAEIGLTEPPAAHCVAEARPSANPWPCSPLRSLSCCQRSSFFLAISVSLPISDEDIVVRIKADAPVLRPDEPVPARPAL
jgi:hypothetical protein